MKKTDTIKLVIAFVVWILVLAALLTNCGLFRLIAEPIDRWGCSVDCHDCEFSRYEYDTHSCYCNCDGAEVLLYSFH